MSYFIFPQRWITPAITAAAIAFGPIDSGEKVDVNYFNFKDQNVFAGTTKPNHIFIDKRPKSFWPKWKAQCILVHQYGHLKGRKHSSNPRNIMYKEQRIRTCKRWLNGHGVE